MNDWTGRVVWVVGASSGIGRSLAEKLSDRGARVAVSARNEAALRQFAGRHAGRLALPLDVTDPAGATGAVDRLLERWGRVDLVVYSVGHYRPQRATAFDLSEMRRHMEVNYVGALHLIDAVLPVLLAQGAGHLSLIGSVAGYRGMPHALAYGPTKAALINLAEALHFDLRPRGIGVSLINPGFVETPLTAQNEFRMPALISPGAAADAILSDWARGRFEIHFPKRFTRVLKLLGFLPPRLYFAALRRATGL